MSGDNRLTAVWISYLVYVFVLHVRNSVSSGAVALDEGKRRRLMLECDAAAVRHCAPFFLHRATRSPWMAIHSKGWWKRLVVLQEFNEDEWRENFCMTLTSFDKLRVWAGVVPSERWHFCTNWLDVRDTRWSRVSLMYERPPWGLVPANRGAFSSGSWSFSCIERIRVQVLSRVDGYKEPQRVAMLCPWLTIRPGQFEQSGHLCLWFCLIRATHRAVCYVISSLRAEGHRIHLSYI